ncbi:hypothetical protein ACSBR1_016110 [Camellia fascicularis]
MFTYYSPFNEEACSPFVKKYKTIIHPRELLEELRKQNSSAEVHLFNAMIHPSGPGNNTEPACRREMRNSNNNTVDTMKATTITINVVSKIGDKIPNLSELEFEAISSKDGHGKLTYEKQ